MYLAFNCVENLCNSIFNINYPLPNNSERIPRVNVHNIAYYIHLRDSVLSLRVNCTRFDCINSEFQKKKLEVIIT